MAKGKRQIGEMKMADINELEVALEAGYGHGQADAAAEIETLKAELKEAREIIEYCAETHDAGRHDGLPEDCPAHGADSMWLRARAFLMEKADG